MFWLEGWDPPPPLLAFTLMGSKQHERVLRGVGQLRGRSGSGNLWPSTPHPPPHQHTHTKDP